MDGNLPDSGCSNVGIFGHSKAFLGNSMRIRKEFLSVAEVAKTLDLSKDRVYEYLRRGIIKGTRLTKTSAWVSL